MTRIDRNRLPISSGFATSTIWTLSGVVLAACGGGGGGSSASSNFRPDVTANLGGDAFLPGDIHLVPEVPQTQSHPGQIQDETQQQTRQDQVARTEHEAETSPNVLIESTDAENSDPWQFETLTIRYNPTDEGLIPDSNEIVLVDKGDTTGTAFWADGWRGHYTDPVSGVTLNAEITRLQFTLMDNHSESLNDIWEEEQFARYEVDVDVTGIPGITTASFSFVEIYTSTGDHNAEMVVQADSDAAQTIEIDHSGSVSHTSIYGGDWANLTAANRAAFNAIFTDIDANTDARIRLGLDPASGEILTPHTMNNANGNLPVRTLTVAEVETANGLTVDTTYIQDYNDPDPQYQFRWFKDGDEIEAARSDSDTDTDANLGDLLFSEMDGAGRYTVRITVVDDVFDSNNDSTSEVQTYVDVV